MHLLEARFGALQVFYPLSRQYIIIINNNNNCLKSNIQCIEIRVQWTVHYIYDGHSHLDGWKGEVRKREDRECLASMPYKTVISYCFSKWWLDSKWQDWWPISRGPLKQAFGVHPTEALDT